MKIFRAFLLLCCCLFPSVGEAAAVAGEGELLWENLEPGLDLARVTVFYPPPGTETETPPAPGITPETSPGALPGATAAPTPGTAAAPTSAPMPDVTANPAADPAAPPAANADAAPAAPALPSPQLLAAKTTIVRIDPAKFSFSLYMASEKGPKTLADISAAEHFIVAVNAGMYQQDGRTNTGYLRSREHTNNGRVAATFGAFFMAEPDLATLPPARLFDRNEHDWQAAINHYGVVMQNYRMTTPTGRVIWKQTDRPHSIAALSQDTAGNILFLLCPSPVPAAAYLTALLRLPLNAGTIMYLEGGSEAALLVQAGPVHFVEAGRHISGLWSGSANLVLPNVLGIRRRER